MAEKICFAGIYMTKGVPNLGRTNPRSKLGTPFSFLRCFPFCGRVLRTAPLDNHERTLINMSVRYIFHHIEGIASDMLWKIILL